VTNAESSVAKEWHNRRGTGGGVEVFWQRREVKAPLLLAVGEKRKVACMGREHKYQAVMQGRRGCKSWSPATAGKIAC
jgi:hypothetical protein